MVYSLFTKTMKNKAHDFYYKNKLNTVQLNNVKKDILTYQVLFQVIPL